MFEFKYTQDPDAETPLMFIDKEIGNSGDTIQGNEFMKELLYLSDTLGKTNICVWINSPGGIVTEGQAIYTGILKCKANVDTYCYGLAASIAGVIFQAGKKRIMTPSATLMYHPAYSEDGKEDKGLESANKTVCTMIAERTGKTYDEVWKIMNEGRKDDKGTWMDCDYALANGFADVKDDGFERNMTITTRTKISEYYNKTQEKPKIMSYKNLNKAMGLNEEAAEAAAIEVFNSLNKSNEDLQDRLNKAKAAYDKVCEEMDKFKADKAKADEYAVNKAKADEDAKAKADAEEMDKKADEDLKNAVANGKIKNDATLIASYKASYKADPKLTKAIIDALPINKVAPTFNANAGGEAIKDSDAEAAVRAMGIKPGTSQWYNSIKNYQISNKTK